MPFAALRPEAVFAVGGPSDVTASEDAVWMADRTSGALRRIDPKDSRVLLTVATGPGLCAGPATDFGEVLLPRCGSSELFRVDAGTSKPTEPLPSPIAALAHSIATGVGSVWVITDDAGTVARLDPVMKTAVAEIYTPPGATSIVFGEGSLWVTSPLRNSLTRINPHNNLIVETISILGGPSDVAAGEGAVWTWNRSDGSVSRIDPGTNTVVSTIVLPAAAGSEGRIRAGEGSVWLSNASSRLTRIDARTNRIAQVFTGTGDPALSLAHGSLWMSGGPGVMWRLDPRRIEATRPGLDDSPAK